jgi:pyruvate formate lyase activating enzyme
LPSVLHGFIFDIQGFSVHDGPGCRTVIFLSGCPLRCPWCSNPEGQERKQRLLQRRRLCRACARCVKACPYGAIRMTAPGSPPQIRREHCATCDSFACIERCWSGALTRSGRSLSVADLMQLLNRDRNYWGAGGGVTFSGGEPMAQADFLRAALDACRSAGIHTAIESCGHAPAAVFAQALERCDWVFFDIKHLDSVRHAELTGVDNRLILANLAQAADPSWPGRLLVRLTVIPGSNDDPGHLRALAARLLGLGIREIQLLPMHRLGQSKHEQLGLPGLAADIAAPTPPEMAAHRDLLQAAGLTVYLDHDAPF